MANASDRQSIKHIPVLLQEAIDGLQVRSNGDYIDATVGGGGHAVEILKRNGPDGRLLGLDADPEAIVRVRMRMEQEGYSERVTLANTNFSHLRSIATQTGFGAVSGILLDLGVSSFQLDEAARGFSFQSDGPLDMRMNSNQILSADVIVNEWMENDIADVLYEYGEERKSRRIARAIVENRPIQTTGELAEIVSRAVGGRRGQRIHPATRTFQGLRIAVNQELTALEETLPQCLQVLRLGGRLAVISFHSLEDRIVKRWMQHEAADYVADPTHPMGGFGKLSTVRILSKKPITASEEELATNPRSRSAKLRVAEKLSNDVDAER